MKRKILAGILAAVMAFSLTACSSSSTSSDDVDVDTEEEEEEEEEDTEASSSGEAEYVLKLSVSAPATGTQAEGYEYMAQLVSEYTDGAVEIQIYSGSSLADKVPSMEGLQDGSIEMTVAAMTDISNFGDVWGTFSLPYIFEDTEQLIEVMNSEDVSAYVEEQLAEIGMVPLMYMDIGSRSILNSVRAIYEPEDLDGLKIRVMQDSTLAAAINAMGGIATPMAWSETYTALQQGTVDGLENSAPIITSNMMHEVAKYYSLTEQFIIADCLLISQSTLENMPEEIQEEIIQACKDAEDYWNNELWPAAMEEELQVMVDAGVEINEVDKEAFQESVVTMKEDWLAEADDDCVELYNLLMEAVE